MQFNGINSQIFLHQNSGFDEKTIEQLEQLTSLQLHKLENWHQEYKPNLTPIIVIDFNSNFDSSEYENPNDPRKKLCIATTHAPLQLKTTQLLQYGRLKGIFYRDQNIEQISLGLKALSQGSSWLTPAVTEQLLSYFQSVLIRYNPPHTINLTRREIEVLEALKSGQSNYQISEQLFVSEHTVKSHLYKIFRKIKVKNRDEAVLWSHHFLP